MDLLGELEHGYFLNIEGSSFFIIGCIFFISGDMDWSNGASGTPDVKNGTVCCRQCLLPRSYFNNPYVDKKALRRTREHLINARKDIQASNRSNFLFNFFFIIYNPLFSW